VYLGINVKWCPKCEGEESKVTKEEEVSNIILSKMKRGGWYSIDYLSTLTGYSKDTIFGACIKLTESRKLVRNTKEDHDGPIVRIYRIYRLV
jgi:hypothetical protein